MTSRVPSPPVWLSHRQPGEGLADPLLRIADQRTVAERTRRVCASFHARLPSPNPPLRPAHLALHRRSFLELEREHTPDILWKLSKDIYAKEYSSGSFTVDGDDFFSPVGKRKKKITVERERVITRSRERFYFRTYSHGPTTNPKM